MDAGPNEAPDGQPPGGAERDHASDDADPLDGGDLLGDTDPLEDTDLLDDAPPTDAHSPDDDPRILLFMRPDRDRELLLGALSERYTVETTTDVETLGSTFDCCVFDMREFARVAGTVQSRRDLAEPTFLPFVLLVGEDDAGAVRERTWEYVDDIIELPVRKQALRSRIANLVERRRTSLRLAEREQRLRETVEDLKLKERAMDESPVGISLAEAGDGEDPLVYVNEGFEALTGYGAEILGNDCRFLQGEDTDPQTRAAIREAIDDERPVGVDIVNYRANGQRFWNRLTIAPIRDDDGTVTHYVGFQSDITDRKIRERRLEVMGRVLNHNLRNKMNLIDGYMDLLRRDPDAEERQRSLDVIAETTEDLMGIAETVRKIDHTLSETETGETTVELRDRLSEILSRMTDQYPNATFDLSVPEDTCISVTVVGLETAIEEAVENAVKHNDDPNPTVQIRVDRRDEEWIDIEIEDDGPGIPEHETHVLKRGETSLKHADRLGIWLMYWVVSKAGGEFSVESSDTGGTILRMGVPTDP